MSGAIVLAALLCASVASAGTLADQRTISCAGVKPIFQAKNVSLDIPDVPITDAGLSVCDSAAPSCCTKQMETNLHRLVRNDFQALLHHNSRSLEGLLASTAAKLHDHVTVLSRQSHNKTDSLFNQVYQRIAMLSGPAIDALYADIASYLVLPAKTPNSTTTNNPGEPNLDESVRTFFAHLFPLIYHHAVNPHLRDFSVDYKSCLRAAMAEIQPFGGVPRQLGAGLAKTMEATRVLLQALTLGAEVLNSTDTLLNDVGDGSGGGGGGGGESEQQGECHAALLRMSYCPRCQGLAGHAKPCAGYCLNVLRGCVTRHAAELDLPWNGFVEAIERLVVVVAAAGGAGGDEARAAPSVERVLTALDSRILEAIMYAMENGPELEKKVKRTCGPARWLTDKEPSGTHHHHHVAADKDQSDTSGPVLGVTFTQGHISTGHRLRGAAKAETDEGLNAQLHHFLASLAKSRGFYANLAESLCSDDSFAETRDTADCWNGKRVGEYTKTVVAASLSAQKYNPELAWTPRSPDARIAQLSDKLRHIRQVVLSQLTLAPESDSYLSGVEREEGSGSGDQPGHWVDQDPEEDRDTWDEGSGSGDGHSRPGMETPGSKTTSTDPKVPTSAGDPRKTTSSSTTLQATITLTAALSLALFTWSTIH